MRSNAKRFTAFSFSASILLAGCTSANSEYSPPVSELSEREAPTIIEPIARPYDSISADWASVEPEKDGTPWELPDCPSRQVSTCGWALAADALVVATVEAIHLASEPAVKIDVFESQPVPTDECDGVEHALRLELQVKELLFGEGPSPGPLTLQTGSIRRRAMSPIPVPGPDESIDWLGPEPPPLAVGRTMILAMHRISTMDSWSLLGEPLAWVEGDGRINLQGLKNMIFDCEEQLPGAIAGMSVEELRRELASCPQSDPEAEVRLSAMRGFWGDPGRPEHFIAATCFPKEVKHPEGHCYISADCLFPQECIENRCQ